MVGYIDYFRQYHEKEKMRSCKDLGNIDQTVFYCIVLYCYLCAIPTPTTTTSPQVRLTLCIPDQPLISYAIASKSIRCLIAPCWSIKFTIDVISMGLVLEGLNLIQLMMGNIVIDTDTNNQFNASLLAHWNVFKSMISKNVLSNFF